MNAKTALFAVLISFAPTVVGCAAESSERETTATSQDALAIGIQTVNMYAASLGLGAAQGQDQASPVATFRFANGSIAFNTFTGTLQSASIKDPQNPSGGLGTLPQDVIDIAVLLKLGAFQGGEGALGTTIYSFAGGFVGVGNENGELRDVGFNTPGGGDPTPVPGPVARAAAHSRLGTFVSRTNSGSLATARFTAGTVTYDFNGDTIYDVTLTGIAGPTRGAAAALGVGAYVRGTHSTGVDHDTYAKATFDYDTIGGKLLDAVMPATTIPGNVVSLAVGLNLGAYVDTDGGMETVVDNFQNGSIAHLKNQDGIGTITVKASSGQQVNLPLPVAQAAAANAFGIVQSAEGAAGSVYFSFADGTIQWSNITQTLVAVTLK